MIFRDRKDAGRQLAKVLIAYRDKPNTIVLALPRGGVPVAFEVCAELRLPLDMMLVRKLGVPHHEEFAMGAIAEGGVQVLNEDVVHSLSIADAVIADVVAKESDELKRRSEVYRHGRPAPDLNGRTIILVDDGCATGANMKAAVAAAEKQHAGRVVVAVPVASQSSYEVLKTIADEVICLELPEQFLGVGSFYRDFSQTSDGEVKTILKRSA